MTISEKARANEENIRQALHDYIRHTSKTGDIEYATDAFISRLALDNARSKDALRTLFRKSPVWNEDLDALVINGTRTHNPDKWLIAELADELLLIPLVKKDCIDDYDALHLTDYFLYESGTGRCKDGIETLQRIAPKAYKPGRRKSRVFRAICQEFGLWDETAGSDFQRKYAQLADELSSRRLTYKLFVSLNPAHFLTMSNPKYDDRGETLTSCHSLNNANYDYRAGCAGYARDNTSFIVFTVDDPKNPELLNNRKTTRQIFAYTPGSGLLLQSRMYNTSGGVRCAVEESKEYRDLVQRELSMLEDKPNLWQTYHSADHTSMIVKGRGFGGYPDWIYRDFDGHISVRADADAEHNLVNVGAKGLCIICGNTLSDGIICEECAASRCADCGAFHIRLTETHLGRLCPECLKALTPRLDELEAYFSQRNRFLENTFYTIGVDYNNQPAEEQEETANE